MAVLRQIREDSIGIRQLVKASVHTAEGKTVNLQLDLEGGMLTFHEGEFCAATREIRIRGYYKQRGTRASCAGLIVYQFSYLQFVTFIPIHL